MVINLKSFFSVLADLSNSIIMTERAISWLYKNSTKTCHFHEKSRFSV